MSTPVPHPDRAPGLPGPQETASKVSSEPLDQPRDIGWAITLLGAAAAMLASWTLFPISESDGMWAGYWTSLFGTAAVLGAFWLRSTLPMAPGVALTGLCGLGMVLIGALHDYDAIIKIPMIAGGALIVLGAVMQAAPHRS